MIRPRFRPEWCLLIVAAASSWVDELIQRYEAQGLGLWDELDSDWVRRTQEYGIRRPTQEGRIFVYRAFDLWSHTGPFYRATVVVHQVMLPDEILWRIALHWPDLGHEWNRVGWRLVPVDDSRSSSCLPDLISPTYVLVMHGLLGDMCPQRVDAHGQTALIRGLHQRYPDLVDDNSYLVNVHWSLCSLEPGVNHAKERYVLAVIEEDFVELTVVLKVDLPPYVDIGAIRVPQTLTKRRLILQTGLDLVCGPGGEICACYHNGYELLSEETVAADDGDFFACWLDGEPRRPLLVTAGGCPVSPMAGWETVLESTLCPSPAAGGDNRH